jgi:hypothetical protein
MNTEGSLQYASVVTNLHGGGGGADQSSSENKANIFDILSHEGMQSLLHPAFEHFYKWLTSNVSTLARFQSYGDEVYLAVRATVELLYMKAYNAMLAEHFYGMRREPVFKSRPRRLFSTLFSILVPYFKTRMDRFYEELEKNIDGQQNDITASDSPTKLGYIKTRVKKFILNYYPHMHLAWAAVFWYYRIAFIVDKSDYHTPVLAVLGERLVYDTTREALGLHTLRSNFLRTVLYFGNSALTAGLYFLQLAKWQSEREENGGFDDESEQTANELPSPKKVAQTVADLYTGVVSKRGESYDEDLEARIPPPPELPECIKSSKFYRMLAERPNVCPLCSRERTNECALGVSGFVFCYPCIFRFVKENKCCPVTGCPCSTKSIVRLYPSFTDNDS